MFNAPMSTPIARPMIRQVPQMGSSGGGPIPSASQPFLAPGASSINTGAPQPMSVPSMTRPGSSFPNPMANPLGILANAKMEHAGMIIKGLLKHLDKSTVDVNNPGR